VVSTSDDPSSTTITSSRFSFRTCSTLARASRNIAPWL